MNMKQMIDKYQEENNLKYCRLCKLDYVIPEPWDESFDPAVVDYLEIGYVYGNSHNTTFINRDDELAERLMNSSHIVMSESFEILDGYGNYSWIDRIRDDEFTGMTSECVPVERVACEERPDPPTIPIEEIRGMGAEYERQEAVERAWSRMLESPPEPVREEIVLEPSSPDEDENTTPVWTPLPNSLRYIMSRLDR